MSQQRMDQLSADVSRYMDGLASMASKPDWEHVANDISCMVALAAAGKDYSRYKAYAGNAEERHAAAKASMGI